MLISSNWLAGHYGSQRGFIRTYACRTRYFLGCYRGYRKIDWNLVERLVFVCKGNVCRSPYAEAVAHSLGIESISCGIDTRNGIPANKDAISAAAKKGIDLTAHEARSVQSLALRDTDLILAMEPRHVETLRRVLGTEYSCSLLGLWERPVTPHIQDPYGTSALYFSNCFNYIEKSVYEVARKIKETSRS